MSDSNNSNEKELVFIDDNGTIHKMDNLSILWQNFTGTDGTKRFPRPWEFNEDGTVKTEGAKLVISYLNGDPTRPVITGCIENLGAQQNFHPSAGTNMEVSNREIDNNHNEDFKVSRSVSPNGDVTIELENLKDKAIQYHVNVKGGNSKVYINSEGNTYIGNNHNQIQFEGNKIFIGSRDYSDKAKEVGINAERIILGNSTFYHPDIKTDIETKNVPFPYTTEKFDDFYAIPDNTKHQWAVLGETLVHLMKKMIEIWGSAKYQGGSTICTVSWDDYDTMKTQVYDLLPSILSSSVSLINKLNDPIV